MAVKKPTQPAPAATSDRKEADGFLNLTVVDKAGNVHKIQAVIPLYEDNRVHKALMGKGTGAEISITGTIHVVDKNPADIEL